jgi:anti-anti-sigma factor
MRGLHLHSHPAGSRTTVEPHSTLRDVTPRNSGPPLTIAVGRAIGTVVVTVRGEIGEHDAAHLNAVLDDILEENEKPEVVVDLRRLHQASGSAVAALAAAAALAAERGIAFRLSESTPQVRRSLESAGLSYAFGAATTSGGPAWVTSLRVG